MKAISLWQPWAGLIAIGAKRIETRSWPTKWRGIKLAIHAAKRPIRLHELMPRMVEALAYAGIARLDELPLGAIVAVVTLDSCVSTDTFLPPEPERSFGDYSPGRFAWKLKNIEKLDRPILFKGAQGFFDVPNELLGAVKPQHEADSFHFA